MSYQNKDNNQQYPSARSGSEYQGRRFREDESAGNTRLYVADEHRRRQQYSDNYDVQPRQRQQRQYSDNYDVQPRQQRRYSDNYDVQPRQQRQYSNNYDGQPRQRQYNANYDARQRQQQYNGNYDARRRQQQYNGGYDDRRRQQQYYDDRYAGRGRNQAPANNNRGGKKKKRTSPAIIVVRVIAILILVASLVIVGIKLYSYYTAKKAHGELQGMVSNKSLEEYQKLHEMNSDFFGWLEIEGTVVDYPVMYAPYETDKYLHLNFEGNYSESGELFLDEACDPNGYLYLIYGHHMRNGSMFGALPEYDDVDYYNEHRIINFDTCSELGKYEVFAVFYSQIYDTDDDVFKYYEYTTLNEESTYNYYVEQVKNLSTIDTGITPTYGEKIITLSTCNYHTSEGRFVVCARKIQ